MMRTLYILLIVLSFQSMATDSNYESWKKSRSERLQQPHGWLSLVGLEWLHVGSNSIGAADDNDIKLSHGPSHLGSLLLDADQNMTFKPVADSGIKANGQAIGEPITVYADTSEQETTLFEVDSFQFYVVDRDKLAFRIKDSEADTRVNFKGLEYFPESEHLRIDAQFVPYEPIKMIPTVNVLGILTEAASPGRLEFTVDGKQYSLDALDSTDSYYMIFADKTNGKSTYGPGRFLYTDGKVDENGMVRLDFNKAYNPPCAFTAYSTCTLPPLQNRLAVKIEAGEKKYADSVY